MPLITLLVLGVFGTFPGVQAPSPGEGTLALTPSVATVVNGSETSVFPLWPLFDLEVRVANVTNIIGLKFSCEWNPAHFKFVGIMMGTKDPSDFIYEAAKAGSEYYGPGYTIVNSSALHEFYYTQLGGTYGYAAKNWTGVNTGLVTKLRFNYTGPSPTIGYPIDTSINITNRDLTELMRTNWAKWITGTTLSPTDFSTMLPCHFHYEVVETLVHDVEGFNVVTVGNTIVSTPILSKPLMQLSFNVTGTAGITGFCNVTIPKALFKAEPLSSWIVVVDSAPPDSLTITDNATHTFIYFTYTLASTLQVTIQGTWVVPEFPALTFLILLLTATIAATAVGKKVSSIKHRGRVVVK